MQDLAALAFISLGSNLGDRRQNLLWAVQQLEACSDAPLLKSSFRQTAPVDCPPGSPPFLNAAVGLLPRPGETPESLLAKLQSFERQAGRRRGPVLNAPRPLDLDLITFGRETRHTTTLVLPHPRARVRRFVLEPLAEIAPDLILPGQSRTVAELLRELNGKSN